MFSFSLFSIDKLTCKDITSLSIIKCCNVRAKAKNYFHFFSCLYLA